MTKTSEKKDTLGAASWNLKPISKEAWERIMAASREREEWFRNAHVIPEKHLRLRINL